MTIELATLKDWLVGPGSNCFTDSYGAWPLLLCIALGGAALVWNRRVGEFAESVVFRRDMPLSKPLTKRQRQGGVILWRLMISAFGGFALVAGSLALVGALPCD